MKFKKKNIITLGAFASTAMPIVAVISCGSSNDDNKEREQQAPTETGTDQTNTTTIKTPVTITQDQINAMFTMSHVANSIADFPFLPATISGITFTLENGAKTDGLADGAVIHVTATPDDSHEISSTVGTAETNGSYTFIYTVSGVAEQTNIDFYKQHGLDYKTITKIPNKKFQGVILPNGFTLPPNITVIGNLAFSSTTLPDSFTIPQGVTDIHLQAFSFARLPKGFTLPPSAQNLHNGAFWRTVIPSGFKIPAGAKIGYLTFDSTRLYPGFKIPSDVTFTGLDVGPPFAGAILPAGYHWSLPGGAVAGSEVVPDSK